MMCFTTNMNVDLVTYIANLVADLYDLVVIPFTGAQQL